MTRRPSTFKVHARYSAAAHKQGLPVLMTHKRTHSYAEHVHHHTREWPAWISCKTLAAWAPETNARLKPEAPRPVRLGEFPSACVETDQRHASVEYVRLYLTRRSIPPGDVSRTWLVIVRSPMQVATARSLSPTDGQRSICALCPAPCTHWRVSFTERSCDSLRANGHCGTADRSGCAAVLVAVLGGASLAERVSCFCAQPRAREPLPPPRLLNFPRARTRRIQAARHNLGLDLGKFDRR